MNKIQMFCLPYAGGGANIYLSWKQKLATKIDVVPMEYQGHGNMFTMEHYSSIQDAAKNMFMRIATNISSDYILYGHSMGSLVALETAYLLSQRTKKPSKLILGGLRPPHLLYKDKKYTHLPKEEFMKSIIDMGQTPIEIMENEELYDLSYEILYSDFSIIEAYKHNLNLGKLDVPITVFTGDQDEEAPSEDLQEWNQYTTKEVKIMTFHGNHFFAFDDTEEFWDALEDEIGLI